MYKKAAIFVLIIIFIGLVVFTRPSNLSESFSNWVSPANSPDNKKQVVVLPNLKEGVEVYYDVQNANIYIIEDGIVRVIPRSYSGDKTALNQYDIRDTKKLDELKGLNASSITSSTNQWVYADGTNYITYSPIGTNTNVIISKSENGIMRQAAFDFNSLTEAIDLSSREFTAVKTSVLSTPGSDLILSDSTSGDYLISSESSTGYESTPGSDLILSESTTGDGSTPGSARIEKSGPITVGLFGEVYRTIATYINSKNKANWLDGKSAPVFDVKRIKKNTNKTPHYIGEEVYILFESDTNAKGDNTYLAGNITVDNGDGTYTITYKARQDEGKNPVSNADINVVA